MTSDPRMPVGVCLASLALVAIAGVVQPLALVAGFVLILMLASLAFVAPLGVTMAMVVVLPYFYRPLTIGTLDIAASETLLFAALAGTSFRAAFDLLTGKLPAGWLQVRIKLLVRSPMVWLLIILVAAGDATTLLAFEPDQRSASLREVRWSLVEPLLMIALLIVIARGRRAQALIAGSLVGAGVLAAGHGALDIVTGSGVVADNVRRLSGPLPHPNALALFLVRPLAVAAAVAALTPEWRRFAIAPLAIIGLVLLATFSRGAMLAVVAVAVLLSLFATRRTRVVMFSAVTAMVAFAFVAAGDRMRSAFEGGSASLRLDIWSSALRMVRDSPVWGYGPDQFLYAYAPRYIMPTAWDERFTSHAHNMVLDAWIRLGIIGAIAAVVSLVIVFRSTVLQSRSDRRHDWLSTAALVALAAAMVHGLVDNAYFGHDLAMSSWLLAWLAFSPHRSSALEEPDGS